MGAGLFVDSRELAMWDSIHAARSTPLVVLALSLCASPGAGMQDCSFPTAPSARNHFQPDGSAIELTFRGNVMNHWYEDVRGFPVVGTEAGFFYARRTAEGRLEATEGLVGATDPVSLGIERRVVPAPAPRVRAAGEARSGRVAARTDDVRSADPRGAFRTGGGSVENLVLLLRFSDHGPAGQNRTLPSVADVTTIMNAVGGDPILAPTGSVRDYYLENSYGQVTIDSTVVGWLDMPNTESHYANGSAGASELTWDLIVDALDAADPLVDFSDYDEDGDGWVDAITLLHSGYGAEWGGFDQYGTAHWDRMWSHRSFIPTWTSAEGVKVDDYNISPGLWGVAGSDPGRIGVVCHELGHFFGLPDLYDVDGGGQGAGNWCLMAAGSWGFDGSQRYPSHMSAWCKMKLGWAAPKRLLPGAHVAARIEDNADLYMIDSGYPQGEYLLIENRQPVGFDSALPQGGLAIWHVDEGKGSLAWNDANADDGHPGQRGWPWNGNHYRVALLQADGLYGLEEGLDRGDNGDVYRSGFASVIDDSTTPDTRAYQGGTVALSSNRLQDIGASSASVSFTYVNDAAPRIKSEELAPAVLGIPFSHDLTRTGGSAPFTWSEYIDDPRYTLTDLGPQAFALGGVVQHTQADEAVWTVNLPFSFPYYETNYTKVYITPNGTVDMAPLADENYNATGLLRCLPRIAGLWDDLTTEVGGFSGIYVDAGESHVRMRWRGKNLETFDTVNFAITLYSDGRIRFDYGPGNTHLTPTVGISRGHGGDFLVAGTHDGEATLTNANSLEFTLVGSKLPPGLSLSSSGVLSGTPTTKGVYKFRVRVSDSANRYDQRLFTMSVAPVKVGQRKL